LSLQEFYRLYIDKGDLLSVQNRSPHVFIYPICDRDRTFTRIFYLNPRNSHTQNVNHIYQNPVVLAKKYRSMIDSGEVENQSDLAQKLGISKVRVCQVLSLLKLNGNLLDAIERIGNPKGKQMLCRSLQVILQTQNHQSLSEYIALTNSRYHCIS
jgi:hypothetical protein